MSSRVWVCGALLALGCDGGNAARENSPITSDGSDGTTDDAGPALPDADALLDASGSEAAGNDAHTAEASILPDPYIVVTGPGPYRDIAAGEYHTCAIRVDGTLHCWGRGTIVSGCGAVSQNLDFCAALGLSWPYCFTGSGLSLDCGQALPPEGQFTKLALGRAHSCGLRSDGIILCWGDAYAVNRFGCDPVAVGGAACPAEDGGGGGSAAAETFTDVAAHHDRSCAIRSDGTLICWGDVASTFIPEKGPFRSVAVGFHHVCAIRDNGFVSCWGIAPNAWTMIPPTGSFDTITMDSETACGLRPTGEIACWDSLEQFVPQGSYVRVATGPGRACALDASGDHVCFGYESRLNTAGPSPPWLFNRIALGPLHTCGILLEGSVACWGNPSGNYALGQP